MQTIVETPAYLRKAKQAGVTDDELQGIVDHFAAHPDDGELIVGTGGVRKARIARPGVGKSGGYRVITFFHSPDFPLFLLTIYAKGQKVSLSMEERNQLTKLTATLIASYRALPPRGTSHRV